PIALANRSIGGLDPTDKATAGKVMGAARAEVAAALAARQAELEAERDARVLVQETVDVTLPADRSPRGARHPLASIEERIADVFVAMGWEIAEGPEVEAEWFNFDALNFGVDHPARQMQDTFYVGEVTDPSGTAVDGAAEGLVLRTHPSPVQPAGWPHPEPRLAISAPAR